ncbi:MAG: hypothetical protein NTU98_03840 [Bacteroidetes bacterium]|nr:hypothetical protein [Bacteroidota bacterium]
MKTLNLIILSVMILAIISGCKKKETTEETPAVDNYSSIGAFYAANGAQLQTFTVTATTGGQFTTPQGTKVTIPADAFVTQSGGNVTGSVSIGFKDVYKKSDMLLSKLSATTFWGIPMKSAGMFFIKATQNNAGLDLNPGKKIVIEQPLFGLPVDTAMIAMIQEGGQDSIQGGWVPSPWDSLTGTLSGYVFSLYRFRVPADSGTWCNSDNPNYFTGPLTHLILHPLDSVSVYNTDVFLIFKNVNSMVHVYYNSTDFPYDYAPLGLECTVVAVGVKGGKLYSSFTPITITANLTVNFSLTLTTTTAFLAQMAALP